MINKTALGLQVVKDRSVQLSAQQRSALIVCDGKRSAEDVVRMTAAVGVTMQDLLFLHDIGLVEMGAELAVSPVVSSEVALEAGLVRPDLSAALNAAITLCANLGSEGFSLNMLLTSVDSLEKLQKIAPDIRRVAGDAQYKPLHTLIYGESLK